MTQHYECLCSMFFSFSTKNPSFVSTRTLFSSWKFIPVNIINHWATLCLKIKKYWESQKTITLTVWKHILQKSKGTITHFIRQNMNHMCWRPHLFKQFHFPSPSTFVEGYFAHWAIWMFNLWQSHIFLTLVKHLRNWSDRPNISFSGQYLWKPDDTWFCLFHPQRQTELGHIMSATISGRSRTKKWFDDHLRTKRQSFAHNFKECPHCVKTVY